MAYGRVIFTAPVRNIASGNFTDRDDVRRDGPRPGAPTNVMPACGGDNQLTVSWDPVANATSYDLFYSTKINVAEQEDSDTHHMQVAWIRNVTSPFVLTGHVRRVAVVQMRFSG
ncbi:protein of unknown function [Georgfuchsia toluolica]|uniref:Fibronectin type-III domain-containing protein n=1 Tax=Georgfuchsia toluolica TaxID=424218 RepID=A0A916J4S9_9PROT|nr:hypothetical protein [Georgfuchsia toluolica]CAG4883200.1 protein of unknown function [Georgfuchsia toluolica]